MSKFLVKVQEISGDESLHIVTFKSKHHTLKMMSLDLTENIKEGVELYLETKATSIAIAKEFQGELSYSNQLNGRIVTIEMGKVLTHLYIDIKESIIESIITTDSAKRMELTINDKVTALIKSSDLSIAELA